MNIHVALQQGARLLDEGEVSAPRLTAEVLLAHALGRDRSWLFAHSDAELSEVAYIHYGRYLHERLQGKPTQYITQIQEFYGHEFRVTRDVLIPRPETEHVVEAALERRSETPAGRVIDIGCGSGAIGVSLALELGVPVIATDISEPALRVAAANARRLGAAVRFIACDLASAVSSGTMSMVASNPPYVPQRDAVELQREVRDWEPHVALFAGPDGLAVYRRLVEEAGRILLPDGWLIMEIAYNAAGAVTAMLDGWLDLEVRTDLAGLPRVILARRKALP